MNSMDWIVWERLEKLKSDKKILSKARDEARVIYETTNDDTKAYWRGILRGYERQIVWTQDNIDKLNGMIKEEAKNEEIYREEIVFLRETTHE